MYYKHFQVGLGHYPNCFAVKAASTEDLAELRTMLCNMGHQYIFVISDMEAEVLKNEKQIPVYDYSNSEDKNQLDSLVVQELKLAS